MKRYSDALSATKTAMELGANDSLDWGNLGDIYMSLGRLSDAESAFKQEVKLEPAGVLSAHGWENLYRIYQSLGRSTEAKAAYEQWQTARKRMPTSKTGF